MIGYMPSLGRHANIDVKENKDHHIFILYVRTVYRFGKINKSIRLMLPSRHVVTCVNKYWCSGLRQCQMNAKHLTLSTAAFTFSMIVSLEYKRVFHTKIITCSLTFRGVFCRKSSVSIGIAGWIEGTVCR